MQHQSDAGRSAQQYAEAAYLPERDLLCRFPGAVPIHSADDHGFILPQGNLLIVAISGSNDDANYADLYSNLQTVGSHSLHSWYVHRGFASGAIRLATRMQGSIEQWLDQPGNRIVFTGHSRGGAIATLLPLALQLYTETDRWNVVTFAAPKCWRIQNTEPYPGQVVNFIQALDIVPHVPRVNYRHIGYCVTNSVTGMYGWLGETGEPPIRRAINTIYRVFYHALRAVFRSINVFGRFSESIKQSHAISTAYDVSKWRLP